MCFSWFRRKNKRKNRRFITKQPIFRIPQIVKVKGLKSNLAYQKTEAISPIFGRNVKDGEIPKNILNHMDDVRERYDAFRDVKKVSKEELIAKYGTIYREFNKTHTNESSEKYLGYKIYNKNNPDEIIEDNKVISPITASFSNDMEEKIQEERNNHFSTDLNLENLNKLNKEYYDTLNEEKESKVNSLDNPFVNSNIRSFNDDSVYVYETTNDETILDDENYFEKADDGLPDYLKPEVKTVKKPTFAVEDEDYGEYVSDTYQKYNDKPYEEKILPDKSIFSTNEITLNDKPEWLLRHIEEINDTLKEFAVEGKVVSSTKGPTVTRYEIELERGIHVKKISNLIDNFKMNLAIKEIRMQAPIPGKPFVGIEVPNEKKETVLFGNCINTPEFQTDNSTPLKIVLGQDIDGDYIYKNIASMPHLLIAGATNSGKSVCVNSIIMSLLLKNTRDDLRLILIDPKQVELSVYNDIPHLITPVITNAKIAAHALNWAVLEMEQRYNLLAENRVKDIASFNAKVLSGGIHLKKLPYIVIVIDELADLMAVAETDVEMSIQRLTAKARAAGIHIIIATQRPTTDVLRGVIKANITSRIAFRVASRIDSNTIIDQTGAEDLLGQGDMLYHSIEQPHRIQGAFIPQNEIDDALDFIRRKSPHVSYIFTHAELVRKSEPISFSKDEIFKDVAEYVVREQNASANSIQRHFGIGFNRAYNLLEDLERAGIVSTSKGNNQARDVLIGPEELRLKFKNE